MPAASTPLPSLADRASRCLRLRQRRERIGEGIAAAGAAMLAIAVVAIPLFLLVEAWGAGVIGRDGTPLLILLAGTVKATVAALLVAVPLGIGAAIHVAVFAPAIGRERLRSLMETLEALPSVVIGLVAAIWLAPLLKARGAVVLVAVVALMLCLLLLSRLARMEGRRRWALLPFALLPLPVLALWLAWRGLPAEGYWQPLNPWNAVLVGIAMGLANVPMLFNHAEAALRDALDRHGTAALALGARPLQLLRSLILPLALPQLAAATLVVAARCSGETMIVLMASANTPIASLDPFDGLRSLAAELALTLPITGPGSPAYARLLLATLLLFAISLALDSMARLLQRRSTAPDGPA